jgi:hypothetical protein
MEAVGYSPCSATDRLKVGLIVGTFLIATYTNSLGMLHVVFLFVHL